MGKVWFVFPTLNRYQAARFKACLGAGLEAGVFEVSKLGSYPIPGWRSAEADRLPDVVTLFDDRFFGEIPSRELKGRLVSALDARRDQIGALALLGWGNREANVAHAWALRRRVPCLLLSESTEQDRARSRVGEWVKRRIVSGYSAALVGGCRHAAYLDRLGMPADRIFYGYNAVDNAYFAEGAAAVRLEGASWRNRLGLLHPFFLCACRLVPQKNLVRLLEAYAGCRNLFASRAGLQSQTDPIAGSPMTSVPHRPWDLVILGDGPLRSSLSDRRSELGLDGSVHMPGFKTYDEMPEYLGLASTFVLPSISEPWGLVVNEAMASGLPVLVSDRCGCAHELVRDGTNGFMFDPCDVEQLAYLMFKVSASAFPLLAFGGASRSIIADWGPERFATGIKDAGGEAQRHTRAGGSSMLRTLLHLRLCATSRGGLIR